VELRYLGTRYRPWGKGFKYAPHLLIFVLARSEDCSFDPTIQVFVIGISRISGPGFL